MSFLETINHNHTTAEVPPDYSGEGESCSILDEAADVLKDFYGAEIKSLFIERLVVGVFFTGVKLSNGYGGVAYTPPEMVRNAGRRILKRGSHAIRGMSAAPVVFGKIPSPFADIIRLAAINALSVPFFQYGRYEVDKCTDLSDVPHIIAGRRVCMVGAIIPLLKRLKEMGAGEIKVIDRKKESRSEVESACGEFISPDLTVETLLQCETAIFTGAAVANGTIENLLRIVPKDAAVAVVGPTAGFVPDPLFRRNVALLGTSIVTDSDAALDMIAEGGGAYRLFGSCARKINILNRKRIEQLEHENFPRRDNVKRDN